MASHHHLRHHPAAASYCYCSHPYSPCHHHPPPQPDWHTLYHPPPQSHLYSAQTHLPNSHQCHPRFQERHFEEERETQHTISSLLHRIATLESAIRSRSSSHSLRAAAARTIQTHFRAFLLRRSRTIRQLKALASLKSTLIFLKSSVSKQTHFDYGVVYHRAMELVRRLDTIQGCDPMIRDGKKSVRRELNKFLDFIDGFHIDRMCVSSGINARYERCNVKNKVPGGEKRESDIKRGGMRSVTLEKLRGLAERIDKLSEEMDDEDGSEVIESTDDVFMEKHRVCDNVKAGLVKQVRGVQSKLKKSVSFADNVKVYTVLNRNPNPFLEENYNDEDDDDDNNIDRVKFVSRDVEDDLCREIEEIGVSPKEAENDDDDDDEEVKVHSENGCDDEKESRSCLRSGGHSGRRIYNQGEVDNIAFSAPLPLKMETRADMIDKRKKISS
ncbi:hypothetical protein OROGR_006884 [Orobanche gracilis]